VDWASPGFTSWIEKMTTPSGRKGVKGAKAARKKKAPARRPRKTRRSKA
jgi:hypothetical protein